MQKSHDYQVDCLSNHTACAGIQSLANPRNAYVAILTISELSEDDQNNVNSLFIKNSYGTTTYSVRIQNVEAGRCSNVNLMFSTSTNSYPDGRLACYDDKGFEMLEVTMEDTMVSPGTTCIFLSSGHVDKGEFAVEMLCENFNWKVTLTEL